MNIFVLDSNPEIAASYHADVHINKMILETCQMLGSVFYISVGIEKKSDLKESSIDSYQMFEGCPKFDSDGNFKPFGIGYIKHPCTIWVSESVDNYKWICRLGKELCRQYTLKTKKIHKWESIIDWFSENIPNLRDIGLTRFAMAMPQCFQNSEDIVGSYRIYYAFKSISLKRKFQFFKGFPVWMTEELIESSINTIANSDINMNNIDFDESDRKFLENRKNERYFKKETS